MPPRFDSAKIAAGLEKFKSERLALIIDDSYSTARAILVAPAYDISLTQVNELISFTGGLVFVALSPQRVESFMLSEMTRPRLDPTEVANSGLDGLGQSLHLLGSVEAREGVSTGISAHDRMLTLRILGEATPNPRKLVKPGHIFPVSVHSGGLLARHGLSEAALDIVRLIGLPDAAVFVELLNSKGERCSESEVANFNSQRNIPSFSLAELTRYKLETERLIHRIAEAKLPTTLAGELTAYVYRSSIHTAEHVALVKGKIDPEKPVLTRVHAEYTLGDVFGGNNPPSRKNLDLALTKIGQNENGVMVYLRRPTAGELQLQIQASAQGLAAKSNAMMREYGLGAQILRDLGVKKVDLLTGSKKNLVGLKTFGLEIVSQIPL